MLVEWIGEAGNSSLALGGVNSVSGGEFVIARRYSLFHCRLTSFEYSG